MRSAGLHPALAIGLSREGTARETSYLSYWEATLHEGTRTVRLQSLRRPPTDPPHADGVLERPVLLPRRYTTLSPVPVTLITITDKIVWFLDFQERSLRSPRQLLS